MKLRACIFFLLLTAAQYVFPQYRSWFHHDNFVYGTKAMSLGNAFTAVADDLTAVFWNPAGLAFERSPQFYFAFQAENQTQEHDPQEANIHGSMRRFDYLFSSKLNQINFFSVSAPAAFWKMNWAFALSYYRYLPYGFKGSAVGTLSFPQEGLKDEVSTVNFIGSEGIDVLAFSLATAITEYLSLGCTLQQFFNSGNQHEQVLASNLEFHEQYSENLGGRNFIFGIILRPFKVLNLGFTYHMGLTYKFESSKLSWQVNLKGTEINRNTEISVAEVTLPAHYSLGVALRPAKWLNLSFDYSIIQWRKGTLEDYYNYAPVLPFPQKGNFNQKQNDISNLRLGAEITIPLRLFQLHLRGGWSNEKQLYADSAGQDVKLKGYAAGIAAEFSDNLLLEVAYQRQQTDWIENGFFDPAQSVTSHFKGNLLKFSLTYRFGRLFKE